MKTAKMILVIAIAIALPGGMAMLIAQQLAVHSSYHAMKREIEELQLPREAV